MGVDIGGTKTRAVVMDEGAGSPQNVLADCSVGTASIQSVGVEGSAAALDELVAALGPVAPAVRSLVVGSAGIDTEELARTLKRIVSERFPDAQVRAVHDTQLLLAAGEVPTGCVLIFGTGSAAWALAPDGRSARSGGWGWLLGDEGSGYGLVRESIRRALADLDHERPTSRLTHLLLEAVGLDEPVQLIGEVYARPGSGVWAGYSPAVIQALREGCPVAAEVFSGVVDAAANEVIVACRRVGIDGPVVLAGGLVMNVSEAADGVRQRLEAAGLHDIRVLHRDPVWGAVDLARQALARQEVSADA